MKSEKQQFIEQQGSTKLKIGLDLTKTGLKLLTPNALKKVVLLHISTYFFLYYMGFWPNRPTGLIWFSSRQVCLSEESRRPTGKGPKNKEFLRIAYMDRPRVGTLRVLTTDSEGP